MTALSTRLKGISDTIFKEPTYRRVPAVGFGIVVNGQIHTHVDGLRKYGTRFKIQKDDMFALGSIGKPLTGFLFATFAQAIPSLRRKGFSTTVNDIFPELIKAFQTNTKKGTGPDYSKTYADVTVAQLMAHVSGVDYMPNYNGYSREFDSLLKKVKSDNTPIDFRPADLIAKRRYYTELAFSDIPFGGWDLRKMASLILPLENIDNSLNGNCTLFKYSGGCIIVASMMEKLSGKSWEELMNTYVFGNLAITKYRYLGTAPNEILGLPQGNQQHRIVGNTVQSFGNTTYTVHQGNYSDNSKIGHTHRPAGVPSMSMDDFGKWIRAVINMYNIKDSSTTNQQKIKNDYFGLVQTSGFTKGGWISNNGIRLSHNGSNGWNYSNAVIQLDKNYGYFVFTNIDTPAARALNDEISSELVKLCREIV